MPTIPKYTEQVGQSAIPNVRMTGELSDEAVGINASKRIAQGFQNLVNTGVDLYAQEKKKADDSRLAELDAQARMYKNQLLYGQNIDGNEGDNGVVFRKGAAAFGTEAEFSPRLKSKLEEIGSQISDEAQRNRWKELSARHEVDFNDAVMRHTASEAREYEAQSFKANIQSLQEDAVYNYHQPGAVRGNMVKQVEAIRQYGQNNGLSEEQIQNATVESLSKTNLGVMTRMIDNGQYENAMAHLNQNEGLMTADDRHRAKAILETASVLGESQKNATRIMGGAKSQVEAMAEARKIKDPKIQDATVKEIETRYVEQARAKKQYEDQVFNQASEHIKQFGEVPPSTIWNQLSLEDQVKLQGRIHDYRKGIEPNTNWGDYYYLKTLSSSPATRDKFLQINLDKEYRNKLDDAAFKELTGLQVGIRNRDENIIKELDGFRTHQEIVNTALNSAGIDPSPKDGSKDAKKVEEFRRKVDIEVQKYQDSTGKKVNNQEMQRIIDNMMVEAVTNKGWIWDTKKRVFEIQPEDKIEDVSIKDIPRVERLKIEQALQKRQIPITDDAVKSLYLTKLRGAK